MSPSKTDVEIINDLEKGSIEAFDILYYRYHKAVYINIRKFIHEESIAEDILQEVFISLWENRAKLDASQGIPGWLFVVSFNKSISFLKKRVKEKIILTEKANEIELVENMDEGLFEETPYLILHEAVNALSPRKKHIIQLCRIEGKTYAEAAGLLGLSIQTVKGYMKESLRFIKQFVISKYRRPPIL